MAALSAFLSKYQWVCDFVIRIAPEMKNVVSFAQLPCNLIDIVLISAWHSAKNITEVEKHPQFYRKHRKNCSVASYFAQWDIR
jgi:hypothetical protein